MFGYIGYEDIQMRRRIRALFIAAGTPVCLIDDKDNSDFITPAIIDRAPVTIAIGSEGLAPVLVRHLKARIEAIVPLSAGRLAHDYAYDEIRISHEQNILLPHLPKQHLLAVWKGLQKIGLASANIGLASDIIACPGLDYCTLATARSIPIAQSLGVRFATRKREQDIGPLKIKISGCINACGHHHVGHIGILGLERAGVENYQITLGGDGGEDAALGNHTGPGFSAEELIQAIDRILDVYLAGRTSKQETFIRFYRRVGLPPFKAALYPGKTEAS